MLTCKSALTDIVLFGDSLSDDCSHGASTVVDGALGTDQVTKVAQKHTNKMHLAPSLKMHGIGPTQTSNVETELARSVYAWNMAKAVMLCM